jgi:hypothetical protein
MPWPGKVDHGPVGVCGIVGEAIEDGDEVVAGEVFDGSNVKTIGLQRRGNRLRIMFWVGKLVDRCVARIANDKSRARRVSATRGLTGSVEPSDRAGGR